MLISTERLLLREMERSDFRTLSLILQDEAVMTAYEKAFSDEEVQLWLDKQLERYRSHGFGLWAVILRETEEMIGQCGLTLQEYNGMTVSGTFSKKYRYYDTERYHLAYSAVNPNRPQRDSQNNL